MKVLRYGLRKNKNFFFLHLKTPNEKFIITLYICKRSRKNFSLLNQTGFTALINKNQLKKLFEKTKSNKFFLNFRN